MKTLTFTFITKDEQETKKIARALSTVLRPGDVLALDGELGAGKTIFAKGIAEGLGVQEPIDSPTFTIVKEYAGKVPFYHLDVYRLEADEPLGLEEYLDGDGVCLVEWASRIADWLPEETIKIQLLVQHDQSRMIKLTTKEPRVMNWCKDGYRI